MLKVSSKSDAKSVAGAIANIMRESSLLDVQTIGAGALNQAIKSIIIAKGYLSLSGIDLAVVPSFSDISIGDDKVTAIKLTIKTV